MNILKKIRGNKKQGLESFFLNQHYQLHNIARLKHLESLHFDFNRKKIIELGAGIGDHTLYYLYKGALVTPIEGRKELLDIIEKRLGIQGHLIDAEKDLALIKKFRDFDFIHCYGLLYHIKNPDEFLGAIASIGQTLLLETCVSPDRKSVGVHIVQEDKSDPTQSKSGFGCRPSRKWIATELKKKFAYIYYPTTQPDHPEFPLDWTKTPTQDLIRCIFIASHSKINSSLLTTSLPVKYNRS